MNDSHKAVLGATPDLVMRFLELAQVANKSLPSQTDASLGFHLDAPRTEGIKKQRLDWSWTEPDRRLPCTTCRSLVLLRRTGAALGRRTCLDCHWRDRTGAMYSIAAQRSSATRRNRFRDIFRPGGHSTKLFGFKNLVEIWDLSAADGALGPRYYQGSTISRSTSTTRFELRRQLTKEQRAQIAKWNSEDYTSPLGDDSLLYSQNMVRFGDSVSRRVCARNRG